VDTVAMGQVYCPSTYISPVIIILPVLCSHLHPNITEWAKPGNCKQSSALSTISNYWTAKYFHIVL